MPGFLLTLVIAVLAGWAGDSLAKNNLPAGFWGGILAGLIGSWIGAYMPIFNTLGPKIWGIAIVPAIIGAVVSVFILGLFKTAVRQAR